MKRISSYYMLIVLLLGTLYSNAQEQPGYQDVADKHYLRRDYSLAAPLYQHIVSKRKRVRKEVYFKLADCYDHMQQYPQALEYYKVFLSKDDAKNMYILERIGDVHKILQQYPEAKSAYEQYLARYPGKRAEFEGRIAGCDSAIVWMKNPRPFNVYNVAGINTAYSDWGAAFYINKITFTSEDKKEDILHDKHEKRKKAYGWMGNPYLKLYTADNALDTVKNKKVAIDDFGPFVNNSKYHVGPAAFTSDYNTVFYTVTNKGKDLEKMKEKGTRFDQRNMELYYSIKDGNGTWMQPLEFPFNDAKRYSIGHAALTKDGKILYFTSDMPGGYGRTDIWYSVRGSDGKWQTPRNCGNTINTLQEEAFPTVGVEGELYFASKGLPGLGGFDMFVARGEADKWKQPQNLQLPFNSSYDDFYLSMNGVDSGYFSSNRSGGNGSDDIYAFLPKKIKKYLLKVIVVNANTREPIQGSSITFDDLTINKHVMIAADMKGSATFPLEKKKKYYLKGEYKDFSNDSLTFDTNGDLPDTLVKYLALVPPKPADNPYKVGDKFVLEDLYYDLDKYYIRPDAAIVLDKLVDILRKYPTLEIELSSHTDCRASDAYNMKLSQNRANAAVEYLISQGISSYRLEAKGYGETRLVNRCKDGVPCSPEEHQRNRRTEVRILKR